MNNRSVDIPHRRMRGFVKLILLATITTVPALSGSAKDHADTRDARSKVSLHFRKCMNGSRKACVVDGDTIWLDGKKIRVADIDTPEVS